jgi:hypothetical protein
MPEEARAVLTGAVSKSEGLMSVLEEEVSNLYI